MELNGVLRPKSYHFNWLVVLALLQCAVIVSQLTMTVSAAGKSSADEIQAEFQRSMARYGQANEYHQYSAPGSRELLQEVSGQKEMEALGRAEQAKEPYVFPEPYLLGPKIKDWDEQRRRWLNANPHMKSTLPGKPRVLVVTGSQPNPCESPVGDHFNTRSLKLKIDYARMHDYEIYYNFAWLDPLFGIYWVKLPLLRKLMVTHPEVEWFIWIDSDAMFTDMLFEPPFESYDRDGHNMVMWAWEEGFYKMKDWVSVNVGVFLIRNCQWSLDLIDKWSPMGPEGPVRVEYGKMLSNFLQRYDNYPADDQSALIYLMLTDETVMSKIKLVENDYMISAWWVGVVGTLETLIEKYHPGLGDRRWPWITHFTGCAPCCGGNNPEYTYDMCMNNFTKAYNFADNQVLAYMGYQHASLSSIDVVPIRNETDSPLDFVGINPWEKQMARLAAEMAASS